MRSTVGSSLLSAQVVAEGQGGGGCQMGLAHGAMGGTAKMPGFLTPSSPELP